MGYLAFPWRDLRFVFGVCISLGIPGRSSFGVALLPLFDLLLVLACSSKLAAKFLVTVFLVMLDLVEAFIFSLLVFAEEGES